MNSHSKGVSSSLGAPIGDLIQTCHLLPGERLIKLAESDIEDKSLTNVVNMFYSCFFNRENALFVISTPAE